jgi:tRNA A-37 threonylcarbamoyl transferase component Bud32
VESLIGRKLGQVQIEALIGRGGVAEVYLGTHASLERKVAVKVLRNIDEETPHVLERFNREARVVAKLRHPNIVQVYDFDTVDNNPYLVMEFVEGPSLSKYLSALHEKNQRLPLSQVVRIIRAIASALQYAHNNGVIHRDVKPGNILLTSPSTRLKAGEPLPEDFEPILTDFGLVRFMDSSRQTTTGHIAGTPAYMSPEQSRGETTDGRTDVYALGVVLYEMLAGDVPFDGESTVSILLKQVTEPPPPIPTLSPVIQSVLDRALAKRVKERFQTPTELAEALCAAAETKHEAATIEFGEMVAIPPAEPPPPAQTEEPPAQPQMRWLRIAVPVSIVVLALAGLLWMNGPLSLAAETATRTIPPGADTIAPVTYTALPPTATITPAPVAPGPIGVLQFQNRDSLVDAVSLITQAMPAAPLGSQYEIWLTGANDRLSLGTFSPDQSGKGKLTFLNSEGLNLLSRYDGLEITIEPKPDSDPVASGLIVFSFTLPKEGLLHVRYLLSEFAKTPNKTALVQGLYTDLQQIAQLAKEMQSASQSGDQDTVRQKAELALNLLVGSQSTDYKDWNGDGKIEARGSYGLMLNGSSFGYIQAVYSEANYTVQTADATQYMVADGEVVKICAQNMTQWAPDLRTLLLAVLNAAPDADSSQSIKELVTLADQMLNGIDLDHNDKIDAVAGECGAATAYEHAYRMADMPIMPASISYQLTAVANATPTRSDSGAASTPKAHPTQKPRPTKKTNPGGGGNPGKTKVPKQ